MITKEELQRRSPCLIKFKWNNGNDETIAIVDYHSLDDIEKENPEKRRQTSECYIKIISGYTKLGYTYRNYWPFIEKYGEFYDGEINLRLRNGEIFGIVDLNSKNEEI